MTSLTRMIGTRTALHDRKECSTITSSAAVSAARFARPAARGRSARPLLPHYFSQSLIDAGSPVMIYDPLTGRSANGRVLRDPFPGNRIPQDRINPLSKVYLGYYLPPNRPAQPGSSHDQNFIGSRTTPYTNDRWTSRLDQNWNSRHVTHFTLTRFDDNQTASRWLSPLQSVSFSTQTAHTASLDHTWTVTPTTLLTLRGGVVRLASTGGSSVDDSVDSSGWPMQPQVIN